MSPENQFDNPEPAIVRRERGPEIAKFEEMVASFEKNYPLAELHSIIDLTREDNRNHPLRKPARIELERILGTLNILKEKISPEKYEELFEEYKRLSRAVGMLTDKDKVRHEW